jgi:hypothetical protein
MAFKQSRRQSNKSKSARLTSRPTMLPHQRFPKSIRQELRMTCALRGFSALRQGDGKILLKQYEFLERFYHGHNNKSPSQIQMLAEGVPPYSDMYDSKSVTIVSHKSKGGKTRQVVKKYLKENLSRDTNRHYYIGDPITYSDLEKKIGQDLVSLAVDKSMSWLKEE